MKLGPHVITGTPAAMDWVRRAPIVKSIDNVGILQAAQPGAITVFRSYFTPAEQDLADPDFAFNRIMDRLQGFQPTYVELNNEWRQRVIWGLASHIEFTKQCVKRFHAVGQRVAGFSFSTGQPEYVDWIELKRAKFAGVDAIAIHEYWGNQGFSTWNALRYRRVHDWLGGQHPPFIITECGRDAVEGGKAGWQLNDISGEHYVNNELLPYDAEMEQDDYVLGGNVYTAGPTADWAAFNTDGDSWLIPGGVPSVQPGPIKEEEVSSIAIAILPSNQDRNVSPVRPEYNEYGGMHWLAPLIEEKCKAVGINAKYFAAAPESQDGSFLYGLIDQQNAANFWLDQQPEVLKALVNLHTDSGDFSHTFAIYGTSRELESQKIAEAIGELVHRALETATYDHFDKRGSIDYNSYVFYALARHPACLIELCSHVHGYDINTLFARPQQVASAIAQGILDYAGGPVDINWEIEANQWREKYDAQVIVASGYRQRLEQIGRLAVVE